MDIGRVAGRTGLGIQSLVIIVVFLWYFFDLIAVAAASLFLLIIVPLFLFLFLAFLITRRGARHIIIVEEGNVCLLGLPLHGEFDVLVVEGLALGY